jgi:hypothetical protein
MSTSLATSALTTKFEDTELQIIDDVGLKWVTRSQLAVALGYKNRQGLQVLIDRHASEFIGKTRVFNLNTVERFGRPGDHRAQYVAGPAN